MRIGRGPHCTEPRHTTHARGRPSAMATTEQGSASDTADYLAFDELVCRFYEQEPSRPVAVEFGARTHAGLVRPNNEDNYLIVKRKRDRDVVLTSLPVELLQFP